MVHENVAFESKSGKWGTGGLGIGKGQANFKEGDWKDWEGRGKFSRPERVEVFRRIALKRPKSFSRCVTFGGNSNQRFTKRPGNHSRLHVTERVIDPIQIDDADVVSGGLEGDRQMVKRDSNYSFALCKREDQTASIALFLKPQNESMGLIFCRRKAEALKLCQELFAMGVPVDVFQDDFTQKARDKVMRAFKMQRVQFVVAPKVAAGGMDFEELSFLIHHQLSEAE